MKYKIEQKVTNQNKTKKNHVEEKETKRKTQKQITSRDSLILTLGDSIKALKLEAIIYTSKTCNIKRQKNM